MRQHPVPPSRAADPAAGHASSTTMRRHAARGRARLRRATVRAHGMRGGPPKQDLGASGGYADNTAFGGAGTSGGGWDGW
jgi:hypothetical protein